MEDWRVGQRVVCVVDPGWWAESAFYSLRLLLPGKGDVYEIAAVSLCEGAVYFRLREIIDRHFYVSDGFRPVVEREVDIAVFTRILDGVRREAAPAPASPAELYLRARGIEG